jgi:hypothetical protein
LEDDERQRLITSEFSPLLFVFVLVFPKFVLGDNLTSKLDLGTVIEAIRPQNIFGKTQRSTSCNRELEIIEWAHSPGFRCFSGKVWKSPEKSAGKVWKSLPEKSGKVRSKNKQMFAGKIRKSTEKFGKVRKSPEMPGNVRKNPEKSGKVRKNLEKSGNVRKCPEMGPVKSGKVRKNSEMSGKVLKKFGKLRKSVEKFGKVRKSREKSGKVRKVRKHPEKCREGFGNGSRNGSGHFQKP